MVLREEATLDEAHSEGWTEGVWLLPTAHDVEAGDLLSRNFADIVEQARERFDLILVDTPPLLSTDDPRTLATMAKGICCVRRLRGRNEMTGRTRRSWQSRP